MGASSQAFCRDISQRKIAELGLQQKNQELADATQRLGYLSQTDELTGLNNRRGFLTRADEQLKLARRMTYVMSLVFIDVDGLKQINDTHGHAAGDNALTASSDILRDVFRESDLLARIGGDEFAVLAVNAGDDSAAVIRARLNTALDAFNDASGHPYLLSFSLGQLSIPADGARDVEELLAEADLAMYKDKLQKRAKRNG